MADGGSINLRMSLKGADQVKTELASIGPAGSRMARQIDQAMRQPTAGMKALDGGVAGVRTGMEGMASRLGPLGTSLSALGGIGLGVAAALAAVAAGAAMALNQARAAVNWADELADAADKVHIGTTALQEWRFAAEEAGGAARDADTAIDGFQKKLGEGLAGGRSIKWFERLGLGREDLAAFKSTEEALDAVIGKIAELSTEAERSAVAEKLGLGALASLIRRGGEEIDDFRQKARDLGLVMDEALVKRGAAAQREMEFLSQVIDLKLKEAFIDLAPAIVTAIGLVAELATALARAMDGWRDLDKKTSRGLRDERGRWVAERDQIVAHYGATSLDGRPVVGRPVDGQTYDRALPVGAMRGGPRLASAAFDPTFGLGLGLEAPETPRPRPQYMDAGAHFDALNRRIAQIDAEMASRAATSGPEARGGAANLIDVDRAGSSANTSARETERRRREAEREIERIRADELRASDDHQRRAMRDGATPEIRAEAARLLAESQRAQESWLAQQQRKTIEDAGLWTEEVALRAGNIEGLRELAREDEERERRERERRDRDHAVEAAEEQHARITAEILSLAAGHAHTSGERRAIELSLLQIAQRRQRADLEAAIEAEREPEARARLVEALERLPALFEAQARAVERQTAGPLQRWRDAQIQSGGEASEWLQGAALSALDGVNAGLRDAWRNADSAGDAFRRMGDVAVSALNRVVDALLEVALQRMLIQPMVEALFGGGQAKAGGGLLGGLLGNMAGAFFGGAGGLGSKPAGGGVTVTGSKGWSAGGRVGASGLYPIGERGMELLELPVGAMVHDAQRTQGLVASMGQGVRTPVASPPPPPVLNVTVVNQSKTELAAQARLRPDGGVEVVLRDMMKGAIASAGADGTLERALSLSPKPIRR